MRTIVLVCVCVAVAVKHTMYQCKIDVDMLNAVTLESVLANVLSDFFLALCQSKKRTFDKGLVLKTSTRRSAYPHQSYVDTL